MTTYYNSQLSTMRARINDTNEVFSFLDKSVHANNLKQFAANIAQQGGFVRSSHSAIEKMVYSIFGRRFFPAEFNKLTPARFLSDEFQAEHGLTERINQLDIFYLIFTALAEAPLFDVIVERLNHKDDAISEYDIYAFINDKLCEQGVTWSISRTEGLVKGLTATLREFDVIEPVSKKRYEKDFNICHHRLRLYTKLCFLIFYFLKANGLSDNQAVNHRVWMLFNVQTSDVVSMLSKQPHIYIVQNAAGVVMITNACADDHKRLQLIVEL